MLKDLTNSDVIALMSFLVALMALILTVWQGAQNRKHNKLSVRPLLVTHLHTKNMDGGAELCLELRNNGVGPAIIKDFAFTISSKKFQIRSIDELKDALQKSLLPVMPFDITESGVPAKNTALPSSQSFLICTLYFEEFTKETELLLHKSGAKTDMEISYECLYGEKFHFNSSRQLAAS